MKNISIEIKIAILFFVAVVTVASIGVYTYHRYSSIVNTVTREARPNMKLVLLEEVLADLSEAESSIRSYSLIREEKYLDPYYNAISSVDLKIEKLRELSHNNPGEQKEQIDTVSHLIEEKFVIWDRILSSYEDDRVQAVLEQLSKKVKAMEGNKETTSTQKNTILQRFFNRKEKNEQLAQEKESFTEEIQQIERQETKLQEEQQSMQRKLLQQDRVVMEQIREVIGAMKVAELQALEKSTQKAENDAETANRWIAVFSVMLVCLLLLTLYLIFRYVRKNRMYQKALKKAKNEAEQLAKAKERFAANMSHEIRTPLNAIVGFTDQLLKAGSFSREQKEKMEMVQKSAGHLEQVVNDVLDFSKLESGKLALEKIGYMPREVADEVFLLMENKAKNKGITLKYEVKKSVPEVLIGDPFRLRQMLLNLVGNALKFTDKGKVEIIMNGAYEEGSFRGISVCVADTGIGIPDDKLKTIFQDYTQAEMETARKYGGTGLGLTITKKLAELQGGYIMAENRNTGGAKFTFHIPCFKGTQKDLASKNKTKKISKKKLQQLKVLVADDEKYNRLLLRSILEKWNVDYAEVTNGKEAVKAVKNQQYDLVLMDIRMPVLNGLEATKAIREKLKSSIPVIALTAATGKDEIERCKKAGMNDFIPKPFKEQDLANIVADVLAVEVGHKKPASEPASAAEVKNKKVIDMKELRYLANGDEAFITEMLQVFIKTTEEGVANIESGLQKEDYEKIAAQAHKIAGPCRHLKAMELLKYLKKIESLARNDRKKKPLTSLVDQMKRSAQKVTAAIQQELASELSK